MFPLLADTRRFVMRSANTFCVLLFALLQMHFHFRQRFPDFLAPSSPNVVNSDYYDAPEPFRDLHGVCCNCNPKVPESPDERVAMTWNLEVDDDKLQIYRVFHPERYQVVPPDAIQGVESLTSLSVSEPLVVRKSCSLMLDWGVERAAWLELISHDNPLLNNTDDFQVHAAISEFNFPYPTKTKALTFYGNHTYRLETNKELYEGVRFTWLYFDFKRKDTPISVHISNISLVAKIKPVNYTGSFWSSSEDLTKAWYMGAYGVRLNMDENYFNSILIERGDRVAIQGDGHPTIDSALVAFSPIDLIQRVLNQTDSGDHQVIDQEIMAYPLYWSLSVIDYFMATGDIGTFNRLAPHIMKILDARIADFLDPDLDIQWFGWDDRLGNGWCFHSKGDRCTREAHLSFAGLILRVCKDFQRSLFLAYMPLEAQKYHRSYQNLGQRFVQVPEWPRGFGVHSAANAINSGIPSGNETNYWMKSVLNDPTTICSFSQFNQYWILQALGNANRMERALASIKLCWAAPLKLGNGCFWEQSMPDWIDFMEDGDVAPTLPSYCHPWSSGVTAWLTHVMGGIRPLLPGYKEFVSSPYVSIRYPSVSTTIKTPNGKIQVNATLKANINRTWTYKAMVQSPSPGYIGIPIAMFARNEKQVGSLQYARLNDRVVELLPAKNVLNQTTGKMYRDTGSHHFDVPDSFLYIRIEKPVIFQIMALFQSDTIQAHLGDMIQQRSKFSPFPNPSYAASISGLDRASKGDGLHAHGHDGYLLLGCDNGGDISRLPKYIHNLSVKQHGYPGWFQAEREFVGASSDDASYLPVNMSTRMLGMVGIHGIGGEQPDLNSILVDIEIGEGTHDTPLSISLYFVGKTKVDKVAIQAMDLRTLNAIAPTQSISDYQAGVWWTILYDKSVRVRIMNMQGLHLSAIGFIAKNSSTA